MPVAAITFTDAPITSGPTPSPGMSVSRGTAEVLPRALRRPLLCGPPWRGRPSCMPPCRAPLTLPRPADFAILPLFSYEISAIPDRHACGSVVDQSYEYIRDVGAGRPRHQEIAERGEERIGVVARQGRGGIEARFARTLRRARRDERAGRIGRAVDAVGAGEQRHDAALAAEPLKLECHRQRRLLRTSSPALSTDRHHRLAARDHTYALAADRREVGAERP